MRAGETPWLKPPMSSESSSRLDSSPEMGCMAAATADEQSEGFMAPRGPMANSKTTGRLASHAGTVNRNLGISRLLSPHLKGVQKYFAPELQHDSFP